MVNAEERRELISRIESLPARLQAAIAGLDSGQLATPYRDGGWTIAQVVHHLADSHINAYIRMKLILTEDQPTLKPYDQDKWAQLPDADRPPVDDSMAIIRGLHRRWTNLLNEVSASDWRRSAIHPEIGVINLEEMLAMYARHGDNHLAQITGLRTIRGW